MVVPSSVVSFVDRKRGCMQQSLTTPVSTTRQYMSSTEIMVEVHRLLSPLPGSLNNLGDVTYTAFAKLSTETQNRLIELIDISAANQKYRYLRCSIDLLVSIAIARNDSALFDRFAPMLMPLANSELKHLGGVYRRIRRIIGKCENEAAVAVDAYFRAVLADNGYLFGRISSSALRSASFAVTAGRTIYAPSRHRQYQAEHATLRSGDDVVFRKRCAKVHNTPHGPIYYVVMTNLTNH